MHRERHSCKRINTQGKLICPQKMSHKHNNKDPSCLWQLSCGMWVNTRYINSIRGTSSCEGQGQLTSMFDLESPSTGRMRLRTSSRFDPAYASPSLTDSKTPSITEVFSLIAISPCATSHWSEGLPSGRHLNTARHHEGLTPRLEFSKTSVTAQCQLFNFSEPTCRCS